MRSVGGRHLCLMLWTSWSASVGVQPRGVSDFGQSVFLFVGVGTWVGQRRASNYQWNAEEELFLCLCCFKKASLSRFMFPRSLGCPFVCPVSGAAACQATVEETEEEREMKRFCSEAPPQKEERKSYHLKKKTGARL